MKIRFILLITALLPLLAFARQKESLDTISARRAFMEMPSNVLDLISPDTRLDILDYFDAGTPYAATNELRGTSQLKTLTADYAEIEVTPVSNLKIKTLTRKNGDQIVMAIYTTGVDGETRDSEIYFFDADMKPLPKEKFLKAPKPADFFKSRSYKNNKKEIFTRTPFFSAVYDVSPDSPDLKAYVSLVEQLSVEGKQFAEPLLKDGLIYIWNGKQWKIKN